MDRSRVLLLILVLVILANMACGADGGAKSSTEATVNIGKTFAHLAKFREGHFATWIMSITVTLMSVSEITSTMANVRDLLKLFKKLLKR